MALLQILQFDDQQLLRYQFNLPCLSLAIMDLVDVSCHLLDDTLPPGGELSFPDDALPPEGEFSSRKELVIAINAWAGPRGYAFSVKNSWKTSSGRTGAIYIYDRGIKPPRTS